MRRRPAAAARARSCALSAANANFAASCVVETRRTAFDAGRRPGATSTRRSTRAASRACRRAAPPRRRRRRRRRSSRRDLSDQAVRRVDGNRDRALAAGDLYGIDVGASVVKSSCVSCWPGKMSAAAIRSFSAAGSVIAFELQLVLLDRRHLVQALSCAISVAGGAAAGSASSRRARSRAACPS